MERGRDENRRNSDTEFTDGPTRARSRSSSLPDTTLKKVTIQQSMVPPKVTTVKVTQHDSAPRLYPKVEFHDPSKRGHRGKSVVRPTRGVVVRGMNGLEFKPLEDNVAKETKNDEDTLWEKAVRELKLVIAQKDTAIENLSNVNRKLSGDVGWYETTLENTKGQVTKLQDQLKWYKDTLSVTEEKLRTLEDKSRSHNTREANWSGERVKILEKQLKKSEEDIAGYKRSMMDYQQQIKTLTDSLSAARDANGITDMKGIQRTCKDNQVNMVDNMINGNDRTWYEAELEKRDAKIKELECHLRGLTSPEDTRDLRSLELSQGAKLLFKNLELRKMNSALEKRSKQLEKQLNCKNTTTHNAIILQNVISRLELFGSEITQSLDDKLKLVDVKLSTCFSNCKHLSNTLRQDAAVKRTKEQALVMEKVTSSNTSQLTTIPDEKPITRSTEITVDQGCINLDDIGVISVSSPRERILSPRDSQPDVVPSVISPTLQSLCMMDPSHYQNETEYLRDALVKEKKINDELIERYLELEESHKENQETIELLQTKQTDIRSLRAENKTLRKEVTMLRQRDDVDGQHGDNNGQIGIQEDIRPQDREVHNDELPSSVGNKETPELHQRVHEYHEVQTGANEYHEIQSNALPSEDHLGVNGDQPVQRAMDREGYEEQLAGLRSRLATMESETNELREKVGEDEELIEELRANFQREEKWNRELLKKYELELGASATKDSQMDEFQDCLWQREKTLHHLQEQLEFEDNRCEELLEKLIASQKDTQEYEHLVENLQKKLEDQTARIVEYCDQNDKDAVVINNLTEENTKLRKNVEQLTKTTNDLKEDVERLNSSLKQAEFKKETVDGKRSEDTRKALVQASEVVEGIRNKDELIEELQGNVATLTSDVEEMQARMEVGRLQLASELARTQAAAKVTQQELDEALQRCREMEEVCASLRQKLSQKDEQILEGEAEIARTREQVELSDSRIEELSILCGETTQSLNDKPPLIYTELEMVEVNELLEQERELTQSQCKHIKVLENDNKSISGRVSSLEDELEAYQEKLKASKKDFDNELVLYKEKLTKSQQELGDTKNTMQSLENDLDNKAQIITALEGELKTCEEKLMGFERDVGDLKTKLCQAETESKEKKTLLESVEAEVKNKSQMIASSEGKLKTCEKELEETRSAYETDIEGFKSELSQAQRKLQDRETLLESVKFDVKKKSQTIATLEKKVSNCEKELLNVRNNFKKQVAIHGKEMFKLKQKLTEKNILFENTQLDVHRQLAEARDDIISRDRLLEEQGRESARTLSNYQEKTNGEVNDLREKIQSRDNLLKNTRDELHARETVLEETRKMLHARDKVLESTREELHARDSLVQKTRNELANTEDMLNDMRSELEKTTQELNNAREELSKSHDKSREQNELVEHTRFELETAKTMVTVKDDLLTSKETELTEFEEKFELLKLRLDGSNEEKQRLGETLKVNEEQIDLLRNKLEDLTKDKDSLERKLRTKEDELKREERENGEELRVLHVICQNLDRDKQELASTLMDKEAKMSTLRDNLEQSLRMINTLRDAIKQNERKLKTVVFEKNEQEAELGKYKNSYIDMKNKLDLSEKVNMGLREALSEYETQLSQHERAELSNNKELDTLRSYIQDVDGLVQSIRSGLEQAKSSSDTIPITDTGRGMDNHVHEQITVDRTFTPGDTAGVNHSKLNGAVTGGVSKFDRLTSRLRNIKNRTLFAIVAFLLVVFFAGCLDNSMVPRKYLFMFANSIVTMAMFILWRSEHRGTESGDTSQISNTRLDNIKSSFQELHERFVEAVENSTQDTQHIQQLYHSYEKLKDQIDSMRQERLDVQLPNDDVMTASDDVTSDDVKTPKWSRILVNAGKIILVLTVCELIYIRAAVSLPYWLRLSVFGLTASVVCSILDVLTTENTQNVAVNTKAAEHEIDELNEIIDREHELVMKQREAIRVLETRLRKEFEKRIKQRNTLLRKLRFKGKLEDLRELLDEEGDQKDHEGTTAVNGDLRTVNARHKLQILEDIMKTDQEPMNFDPTFSPMFFLTSIPLTGIVLAYRYIALAVVMTIAQSILFLKEGKYVAPEVLPKIFRKDISPIIMDSTIVLYACLLAMCLQCSQGIVVLMTCCIVQLGVHWWSSYRLATKEDILYDISTKCLHNNTS